MKFSAFLAACLAAIAMPAVAQDGSDQPEPVEIMILGAYHFANPGQDVVNLEVDDMLAPRRQREIEILTNTLAEWQPTRVAIEGRAKTPSLEVDDYAETEALLTTDRNESIQIGYRLARMLGHSAVYGFDERA